jgi:hypothetical protein
MPMSLLYALLDIDPTTFNFGLGVGAGANADENRALKYHSLPRPQQQEVREALYEALYTILEYSHVLRTESMAMAWALCNTLKNAGPSIPANVPEIVNFRQNLQLVVRDAIDTQP